MPFLESDLVKNPMTSRPKRSQRCSAEEDEPLCCLYDYFINFEEIGWNWIVHPIEFNAGHCSGECTIHYMDGLRNKLVQKTAGSSSQQAVTNCCASTKSKSLYMLYYNNDQELIYGEFPDMSISECGCL